MGVFDWSDFGASSFGPSSAFRSLPYRGYRDGDPWVEQLIDAMGDQFDLWQQYFISAQARANLLDPTYTPPGPATANLATVTQAPTSAVSQDTMLDVLLYAAGVPWPVDTNLTIAQKQALVLAHVAALKRKGNRAQLLNLAAIIGDGIAVGWTVPPFNFSIILPDGAPSPGYGSWVQPSSTLSETQRPWILSAVRNTLARVTPAFINLGVGYSQFRAGYSSAGETVFPAGARINILAHEHFDTWAAGVPTGWTKTGNAGTLTQSTSDASINWEFTGSAAVLDLTGANQGVSVGLSQTAANINNQLTHRFQLDYKYTNSQSAAVLTVQITDANPDGFTYYWNPTSATWSTTVYTIAVPVSSSRGRYACDIVPQAASSSSSTCGTSSLKISISVSSDGTATTQQQYTLYRVGLYEKFSLSIEQAASGERTAWYPLVDSPGWTNITRSLMGGGSAVIEFANATRTAYKKLGRAPSFSYHPAISGRGYSSASSMWANLVSGSNDFGSDWTLTNATRTANATISPAVGETSPTAPNLTATSTGASISQALGVTPTNKSYVGGVFVKKNSSDSNFTDVTISGISTSTKSTTYSLAQSSGWQLLPFTFSFSGTDMASLSLKIAWGAASSNGQIAVAQSYLYDVTGNAGVLYPPICQTPVGSTAALGSTTCIVQTANTGTNVLHPLTQRTLQSVVRGSVGLTIVPTFDAASQPSAVILDLAQGATQNRVALRVNAGALELRRWDNSGNQWVASLTMTSNRSPAAGSMTWLRDTAITIRCIYDENSTMLSAGNGNASGTKPGGWSASDTGVSFYRLGCDLAGANQFDGTIRNAEPVQLGAPTT